MTYNVIWKNPDNTVIVDSMAVEFNLSAVNAFINSRIAKGVYTTSQLCGVFGSAQLPQDRYFRNAWRWGGSNIELDLLACRTRHLEKLRRVRDRKLTETDKEFLKALDINDTISLTQIKAIRQSLRDMPQNSQVEFNNATTPEAIRAINPVILNTTI